MLTLTDTRTGARGTDDYNRGQGTSSGGVRQEGNPPTIQNQKKREASQGKVLNKAEGKGKGSSGNSVTDAGGVLGRERNGCSRCRHSLRGCSECRDLRGARYCSELTADAPKTFLGQTPADSDSSELPPEDCMASKTLDGPSTNSEINDAAVSDEIVDTNDDVDTYDPPKQPAIRPRSPAPTRQGSSHALLKVARKGPFS